MAWLGWSFVSYGRVYLSVLGKGEPFNVTAFNHNGLARILFLVMAA